MPGHPRWFNWGKGQKDILDDLRKEYLPNKEKNKLLLIIDSAVSGAEMCARERKHKNGLCCKLYHIYCHIYHMYYH